MMKATKVKEVTTEFGKGEYEEAVFEEKPDYLGILERDSPFVEGVKETIFGRCDQFGYMSHMCYSNITGPGQWDDFLEHAHTHGHFYFDAGGNGYPVRISYEELKRVMTEFGLIED